MYMNTDRKTSIKAPWIHIHERKKPIKLRPTSNAVEGTSWMDVKENKETRKVEGLGRDTNVLEDAPLIDTRESMEQDFNTSILY